MSKIILYIATSSDGYISTIDGGVSWLDQFTGTKEDYGYSDFIKSIDCNIQGANTYKQVLTFGDWPYNSKSYVVTNHELEKPEGADIEFVSGDIQKIAEKAKEFSQKNIWLLGGANLVQSFLKESLIDEMMIFTMPVLLGSGISLFDHNEDIQKDELVTSKKYESSAVLNHYVKKI